jgi:hypothetical protein
LHPRAEISYPANKMYKAVLHVPITWYEFFYADMKLYTQE